MWIAARDAGLGTAIAGTGMALSDEQRAARAGRLGSSDAVRIMAGRWREVWREKTGRAVPRDLDLVPAVQIGIATEHLHARFYAARTGIACQPADGRTFVHPEHDFLVAHLDFLTWRELPADPAAPADTVLEAKFHAGPKSDEELVAYYWWQLQHQMLVSGYRQSVLSMLRPSSYGFAPVAFEEEGAPRLLETLRAFWWHVEHDVEPEDFDAVEPSPEVERLRVVNMARHNEFVSLSYELVRHRAGVVSYQAAEVALKGLMPEDARVAFVPPAADSGEGIVLTRARDGKLSLRFGDLPRKYRMQAERWRPETSFTDAAWAMPPDGGEESYSDDDA
jgi:YqaJ-like viral recombinase domain